MNCTKARRQLDMYMDSELSVPENMEVLEHLNLCRACQEVFQVEEKLRDVLKVELARPEPPVGLADRVRRAVREAPPQPAVSFARRGWKIALAAAASITIAAFVFLSPGRVQPQALAAEVASRHGSVRPEFYSKERPDAMRLDGKPRESLEEFFHRYVSYEVCLHDLKPLGYAPVGGSVWEYRGQRVAWTTDRDARGHSISHALVTMPVAMEKKPMLLVEGGRPVLLVPQEKLGRTCVFVFDDQADTEAFLKMMGIR
jgi:anti-sigma factor RsiW